MYQFLFKRNREIHTHVGKLSGFKLVPQGAIAGFLDVEVVTVNTPLLLASHKIQPRYAIGTVSASEFCNIINVIEFHHLLRYYSD